MRYSLVNRFKGALLGAFLGELPFQNQPKSTVSVDWVEMVIRGTQSLIELGKFDLNDWMGREPQKFPNRNQEDYLLYEVILATLPVVLFYHENTVKLRQILQVVEWHDDPVVREGALVVGYAIALCLSEKLSPTTVIPQTIAFIGETSSLSQELLKINSLLQEKAGLERLQAELVRSDKLERAIAIAFYCFLSTLEDFRLSVLRSHQVGTSTASAITGALSGAYNSTVGIPVSWQLLAQTTRARSQLTSFSVMLKLADALVYVWSGVYDFSQNQTEVRQNSHVIAAPRVIR